ncbi:MAG: alpha/beta fold hydrolase [Gammaproteobacteria bacterium]|nr:alpha/beta fold hydrolase [Gammaproteobacteria bacterium]
MDNISPPQLIHSLSEIWRASLEVTRLVCSIANLHTTPAGDGHPVITIPGYGGADGCMAALRYFLQYRGYQAYGWGLGRNMPQNRMTSMAQMNDFQADILNRLSRRIKDINKETGQKVSLIGWSLGGNYANLLAQSHPHLIRQIITLGTPFGDPRGTAAWNLLKRLNRGTSDESQNANSWSRVNNGKRNVPTTVIYSPIDGIVSPQIAKLNTANTCNIAVNSSHIGFTVNRDVYRIIAEVLARTPRSNKAATLSFTAKPEIE